MSPADLAERYLQAWQLHDLEAILALHTEDSVFTSVATGKEAVGREAVGTAISETFAVWPDLQFEPIRVYTTPTLIVAETVASATQALPFPLGGVVLEPNGRRASFAVADILALQDGLVKRKDSYVDALGYMRQIEANGNGKV
jgi:predicted ester cyclase